MSQENDAQQTDKPEQPSSSSSDDKPPTIYYTTIPSLPNRSSLSPADITRFYHDRSEQLSLLLKAYTHEMELLGEVQFCFITFLIGQEYGAFEQWKAMLLLLCSCEAAVEEHHAFFEHFTNILTTQLTHAPPDFFVDEISSSDGKGGRGNFLSVCLDSYLTIVQQSTVPLTFHHAIERLQHVIRKIFPLRKVKMGNIPRQMGRGRGTGDDEEEEEEEEDEYAPVVVEDADANI